MKKSVGLLAARFVQPPAIHVLEHRVLSRRVQLELTIFPKNTLRTLFLGVLSLLADRLASATDASARTSHDLNKIDLLSAGLNVFQ